MWTINNIKSSSLIFLNTLFLLGFGLVGNDVSAYTTVTNATEVSYELIAIDPTFDQEKWYLGTLENSSRIYGFTLAEAVTVTFSLRVPSNEDIEVMRPFIILVEDTQSEGIKEVISKEYVAEEWHKERDSRSGLKYYTSKPLILDLLAGEYRIEISSASEEGKFMLVVGEDREKESFATAWKTAGELYEFYGASGFSRLLSTIVTYPLGILLLFGLIGVTWRYRSRLRFR